MDSNSKPIIKLMCCCTSQSWLCHQTLSLPLQRQVEKKRSDNARLLRIPAREKEHLSDFSFMRTSCCQSAYPLPKINDLFASLAGGQTFSKLEMASAYLQIPLDEATQKVLIINTHKGLYKYKRFPFGVSAAPVIFKRTMETILQGLPGLCVYLVNPLIIGSQMRTSC